MARAAVVPGVADAHRDAGELGPGHLKERIEQADLAAAAGDSAAPAVIGVRIGEIDAGTPTAVATRPAIEKARPIVLVRTAAGEDADAFIGADGSGGAAGVQSAAAAAGAFGTWATRPKGADDTEPAAVLRIAREIGTQASAAVAAAETGI